jgi:MFS family permease
MEGNESSTSTRSEGAKKLFLGGSKYSWLAMLALWLVFAMNSNFRNFFFLVQPPIIAEFDTDATTMGLIAAIITLAQSVLVLPGSAWSDRGGHGWARKYREIPMALGYMIFSILTGIKGLTQSLTSITILQAIKNMFGGAGEAIEVTAISEWWPLERRGFAQGLHHTAYPWGTLLGGFAVSGILAAFGPENWRYVFLILPWVTLPVLAFFWLYSRQRRYRVMVEETRQAHLTPPDIGEEEEGAPPGALKRTLKTPNVLVAAICSAIGVGMYTGITFWLPLFLSYIGQYDPASVAWQSVVFTVTGGVGQIAWGSISDRLGRKYALIACLLWLAVGLVLLQFTAINLVLLVVIELFAGLATNGMFPVLYTFSSDSSERGTMGIANGMQMVGQGIGGGTVPLILGGLITLGGGFYSEAGYLYGLYFMAGLVVLGAIMVTLFTRETIGIFKDRDRALISRGAARIG